MLKASANLKSQYPSCPLLTDTCIIAGSADAHKTWIHQAWDVKTPEYEKVSKASMYVAVLYSRVTEELRRQMLPQEGQGNLRGDWQHLCLAEDSANSSISNARRAVPVKQDA